MGRKDEVERIIMTIIYELFLGVFVLHHFHLTNIRRARINLFHSLD